jgi:hypothetical protein
MYAAPVHIPRQLTLVLYIKLNFFFLWYLYTKYLVYMYHRKKKVSFIYSTTSRGS